MDIIPFVLSEEDALVMPDGFMKLLSECSTDIVKLKVKNYLKMDNVNKEAQEKVRKNYGDVLRVADYLKDQDLAKEIEKIGDLKYGDIRPSLSSDTLRSIGDIIGSVLDNPDSMAYIPPIDGQLIDSLLKSMRSYTDGGEQMSRLTAKISKHKDLFKDDRAKRYTGTVMKKVMLNRQKFYIITKGIEFLLEKKEEGVPPEQWRIL